jgi:hypothetical protein
MLVDTRNVPSDLGLILHRQIELRTGGCIRSLGIEVTDDWVTITGNAPSYYAKQMALLAVQETLGVALRPRIAIDVTARDYRAAEGRDCSSAGHKRQRPG